MAAYVLDFTLAGNEDWKDSLSFVSGDPPSEVDLTGYTFEQHIRETAGSDFAILTCSTENGRLVISTPATDGVLSWNVPMAVMRSLKPGEYVHDLVLTLSGVRRRVAAGTVTIVETVTRP